MMNKETYERLLMDVTEFDVEDVITTSGLEPVGGLVSDPYEDGFFAPNGM